MNRREVTTIYGRLGLLAFVLIGLCSTNERRPARADEPTPAGSVLEQTGSAAEQTTGKLNRVQNAWLQTQEVLSKGLKGQGAAKPVEVEAAPAAAARSVVRPQSAPVTPRPKPQIAPRRAMSRYVAPSSAMFGSGISVPESVPVYRLVRARSEFEGKGYLWWVNGPEGFVDFERSADGRGIVFTGQPGKYQLMLAVTQEGGGAQQGQAVVRIGEPTPVPVPPTPVPPVPPTPIPPTPIPPTPIPPPKPVVGKLSMVLVRETEDSTPPTARLITSLRTGASAKYLIDKGHTLSILDDDSVGPTGQPSPVVEAWRPHFAGMKLPVLIIVDQTTWMLVHKAEIPATATADNVIELIRQHGG